MMKKTIQPLDLAELLEKEQYIIDEDTGEVLPNPNKDQWELLSLASEGLLKVKRNALHELGYFIPHWQCYNSFEDYCKEFPHEQQCKCYEV